MKTLTKQPVFLLLLALLQLSTTPVEAAFGVVAKNNVNDLRRLVLGTVALPKLDNPHDLLSHAVDTGFTTFDLARTYGHGESERIFGEWMEESGVNRNDLTLITKGGMGEDKYGDPNRPMATLESIRAELAESLSALKTDYVDMYMLHRDDLRMPVSIFTEWMNQLIQEDKVRSWGVSNWSLERIQQAHAYAAANGLVPPTANSPQLSLAVPDGEIWPTTQSMSSAGHEPNEAIQWHGENGVQIMGWESLAKGFMAVPDLWSDVSQIDVRKMHERLCNGKIEIGSGEWRMARIQRAYCTPDNFERRKIAKEIAEKSNLSLAQIALLFSLSRGEHVSCLVGAEMNKHLDEMAALKNVELDEEALHALGCVGVRRQATDMLQDVMVYQFAPPLVNATFALTA
eukprot:CAMPEP_0202460422 /NCGR_PEP_ID=MMETSP1360-20130828/43876_1 /ASSEMBLY_ACC=CAM_ASM_000848 /TAXON_ID=515479 /ORGANISM="Licmophora paradoxa, Strain CCMP2313" /LENGTH=399 /DNA_ID=CAMNT_0049082077 /DNA_START=125 /DNA_END=1324 /DNA_ORIENTATION=+